MHVPYIIVINRRKFTLHFIVSYDSYVRVWIFKMTLIDDSMSDDVFVESDEESPELKLDKKPSPHPSPTGYRDYKPPTNLLKQDEHAVLHKVK